MSRCHVYELEGPYRLVRREIHLDELKIGPKALFAETEFTAISTGTELAAWSGLPPLMPSNPYPRTVGYCNLARVARVGTSVAGLSEGDYILTHQSHRSSFICHESDVLLRVAGDEPVRKALTATYLYHLGYAALLRGSYSVEKCLAIVGLGTIGVATAGLIRASGGTPIVFTNQSPDLFPWAKVLPKSAETTFGGADIVVNTSNAWSDHWLSLKLAVKGGEIICVGFPGRGQPPPDFNPLDSQFFYEKQLSLRHCGQVPDVEKKRNLQHLSSLIVEERLHPSEILSFEAQWGELGSVYERLSAKSRGQYSALLRWQS